MKRAILYSTFALCASVLLLQQTAMHVSAQGCGTDKQGNPIECEPKKRQQPQAAAPTATFTDTPKPTATSTPKPTQTNTPKPTASLTPIAAVIIPPPPTPDQPGCTTSPWAPIAGAALLGLGFAGYYWSYFSGSAGQGFGGGRAWRAGDAAGAASEFDRAFGAQPQDAFAYEASGAQQQVVNTAFGSASAHANDRLRNAGPGPRWWGSIASLMALLSGGATLAALGLGSAGAVSCGSVLPAALGGALLGAALGVGGRLLSKPSGSGHVGHGRQVSDEFQRAEGFGVDISGSGAVSLDAALDVAPDFEFRHDDVRAVLNHGGISGGPTVATKTPNVHFAGGPDLSGEGGIESAGEQRQRGRDVFPELNDRAASTRLRAKIDIREDPPQDETPNDADGAADSDAEDDDSDKKGS